MLYTRITLLISLFLSSLTAIGQSLEMQEDSLVLQKDLTFESSLEEEYYFKTLSHPSKENILGLFLAMDKDIGNSDLIKYKKHFSDGLGEISASRLEKKTPQKKIKTIYTTAHQHFLKKYEFKNHFSNIFTTGAYNCVSATALYALLFDELGIPYSIKETPTHVYLISYPSTFSILVETTDPAAGYYALNEKFKEQFVNSLRKNKLISEAEFRSSSTEDIFNEYYFTESDISLSQLVGIQYANDALYKMDQQEWNDAFDLLEKGYLFYPSEKIKFLLLSASSGILDAITYETQKDLHHLVKVSRYSDLGITPEHISAEFLSITKNQLVDNYQPELYLKSYEYLMKHITDSTIKEEISWVYNYETGRVAYNRGDFKNALKAIEKAYAIKPGNVDIQALLINAIINDLNTYHSNKEVISQLEIYKGLYNELMDNNTFASVLAQAYLLQFGQAYELQQAKEGDKYKLLFEEIYQSKPNLLVEKQLIGRAYSTAAVFYFRNGNTPKAKSLLNEGLAISPDNYEITQRLNMIR